jgi:hypothetical protein
MPRNARSVAVGHPHHITQRDNNRIFGDSILISSLLAETSILSPICLRFYPGVPDEPVINGSPVREVIRNWRAFLQGPCLSEKTKRLKTLSSEAVGYPFAICLYA